MIRKFFWYFKRNAKITRFSHLVFVYRPREYWIFQAVMISTKTCIFLLNKRLRCILFFMKKGTTHLLRSYIGLIRKSNWAPDCEKGDDENCELQYDLDPMLWLPFSVPMLGDRSNNETNLDAMMANGLVRALSMEITRRLIRFRNR